MNAKQEIFCREYLIDLNATKAAMRAGYSKAAARSIGSENLIKPYIRAHVEKLVVERAERTQTSSDDVIRELSAFAFFNIQDFIALDSTGFRMLPFNKIPRDKLAGLSCMKFSNGQLTIDSNQKMKALQMLGRHLGMF